MTLDEARANIGNPVHYRAGHMRASQFEAGKITSVNDQYVFVLYQDDWQAKATNPEHLTLVPRRNP